MTALARFAATRIAAAIASAAERWSDGDFAPRVRLLEAIAGRTGYSVPVVEYALDRLFMPLTASALNQIIEREIGDAAVLPIGRVCVISSHTTIGVALWPALFALCAKCEVAVKDRDDGLIAAFFETLGEELDALGNAAHASTWAPGDEDAPDLRSFDAVVAFGSDETLNGIAHALDARTRFIPFGTRASAGYVARESLRDEAGAREIARGAARDLVLYDTQGCLSLHVLFAERAGALSPERFAVLLDQAVAGANVEFPPGRGDPRAGARAAQERALAAFRAANGNGRVYTTNPSTHAIVLDPPAAAPPPFAPRTLGIVSVDEPAEAAAYLVLHGLPLEGFALSSARDDIVQMALEAGAVRLCRFGELQSPALTGHHGGRARIADFVKWIDLPE